MAPVSTNTCEPWADRDFFDPCLGEWPTQITLDADKDLFLQAASNVLYRLTRRKYKGLCNREMMPCSSPSPCGGCCGANYLLYDTSSTAFLSRARCLCSEDCALPTLRLPGPISSITQIVIDGAVLDPSAYAVRSDRRRVERLDGEEWPVGNDPTRDPDVVPTPEEAATGPVWIVRYVRGVTPPIEGQIACAFYARELARGLCGTCEYPPGMTSMQREGMSIAFTHPDELRRAKLTGIPLVDDFITSVNPTGAQRPPAIVRADAPLDEHRSYI